MRYSQLQRQDNKTERQRFEQKMMENRSKHEFCFDDNVQNF